MNSFLSEILIRSGSEDEAEHYEFFDNQIENIFFSQNFWSKQFFEHKSINFTVTITLNY